MMRSQHPEVDCESEQYEGVDEDHIAEFVDVGGSIDNGLFQLLERGKRLVQSEPFHASQHAAKDGGSQAKHK